MFKFMWTGLGCLLILSVIGCAEFRPRSESPPRISSTERRIYIEGLKAYRQENYQEAIRVLQSLMQEFPVSRLLEDVRWMLGKSYEGKGAYDRALSEYQEFEIRFPESKNAYEAGLRIDFLKDLQAQATGPPIYQRHVGLMMSDRIDEPFVRMDQIRNNPEIRGINTIVLDAYEKNGVYFETENANVIDKSINQTVQEAHARGLKIWARLPVRHLAWFKVTGNQRDLRLDPSKGVLVPTRALDLFNPDVLRRLRQFYLDLAGTGIDGILLDEDPLIGPWEGFGPSAQAAFRKDFGFELQPGDLIATGDMNVEALGAGSGLDKTSVTPLFWKWTGWKTRETFERLGRLIKSVRKQYPDLVWAHLIPASAVSEPHKVLSRSGIDLLEEKSRGIDYFVLPLSVRFSSANPLTLLNTLEDQLEDVRRAIALFPLAEASWVASRQSFFKERGILFYEVGRSTAPPLTKRGR